MASPAAARSISLRRMLAIWLLAMIVLPVLPLAVFTWHGYQSETQQLEAQLQDSNRQFSLLAVELLASTLQETAQFLQDWNPSDLSTADLPFDHMEFASQSGDIVTSSIDPKRVGQALQDGLKWTRVSAIGGLTFDLSAVTRIPMLGSSRVLVRISDPAGHGYRIAYLNPIFLHDHLTSRFDSMINRHIYAIDANGAPIFYTHPELVERPELFAENEPVQRFLSGKTGPVKYASNISGHDRLAFVSRMPQTGWAVIVSADIAESMLDIRERFMWLIVAGCVSCALALIIFFSFSTLLVLPLSEVAKEIRRKDRDPHAHISPPLSVYRIRELVQLVEDVNLHIDHFVAAEQKTIQAEKLSTLGELTTGLAHELGTPLNVVRGSAQMIKRKCPDDSSQVALTRIIHQTERITDLIRNLLDIARLEQVHTETLDVRQVIEKIGETVLVMYPGVKQQFDFPETPVRVNVRRRPIEHALLNLFTNACQAMEGSGLLTVRIVSKITSDHGEQYLIDIKDTGSGIDEQHLAHIFKPFYSTKSAGQGSGLGLALVERVIRENDGSVQVESPPDGGSLFRLVLPASSSESVHSESVLES